MCPENTDKKDPIQELYDLTVICKRHARTCKECYMPIMDEEGNPGLQGEACAQGANLLQKYRLAEAEYFKIH